MKLPLFLPRALTTLALVAALLAPCGSRAAAAYDVSRLLIEGKRLHDAGKTSEAEAIWRTALQLEPGNKVAGGFLRSIGRTNLVSPKPSLKPDSAPDATPSTSTSYVHTSKARQKLHEKLDSVRLGTLQFDEVPIEQVLDALHQETKRNDPERRGVNFIVSHYTPDVPALDPATGLPSANDPGSSGAVVRIVPPIRGATLRQALDAIMRGASPPQRYSVEDWGVLIVDARTVPAVPLHTRWFKIDPNTIATNLSFTFPVSGTRMNRTIESIADSLTEDAEKLDLTLAAIRRHFALAGVDLQPPKSVVLNDRLGMLMVRATLQDLDLIEQAVQAMNMVPPQVQIDVKICEVPEESAKALGFQWLLGPAEARSLAVVTNPPATNSTSSRFPDSKTNSALSGVTGILTPQQYAVALRALKQREDVTFIAAPRVLTPSGRQAQLKTVQVRTLVTGLDLSTNLPPEPGQPPRHPPISEPFELGPVVDVVPYVLVDGRSIQMTVIPSIKEFVGYDLEHSAHREIWDVVQPPSPSAPSQLDVIPLKPRSVGVTPSAPPRQPYPLPVFRLRQMVSTATVWDGQTLVLYTHQSKLTVPDGHPAQKLQAELFNQITTRFLNAKKVPSKALLVFVTPRLVDRAGNAVHTDAEIPARTNSVPPQPSR